MKIAVSPAKCCESCRRRRRRSQQPRRACVPIGDDPPAFGAHRIERRRRFRGHDAQLGMHLVLGRIVHLDRQEGAGADMERHLVQAGRGAVSSRV